MSSLNRHDSPFPLPATFTKAAADEYRQLRAEALKRVRQYGTRTEQAYHDLFDKGLVPLESFMTRMLGAPVSGEAERAFAAAAGVRTKHATLNDMLGLADDRLGYRPARFRASGDFLFEKLQSGGAVVQDVLGCLVLTDPDRAAIGPGAGEREFKVEFAPKTREVIRALEGLHVFGDDLVLSRGTLVPGMMRQVSYTLIDIPKLGRQVAVCDQIGEITFVADKIHPVSFWAGSTKEELRATPGIDDVRYDRDGKWLDKFLERLSQGIPEVQKTPKKKLPPRPDGQLLTEETVVRWIRTTHEKTGVWPTVAHEDVWDKEAGTGAYILQEGRTWRAVDYLCSRNRQGLDGLGSLSKLKQKHGLFGGNLLSEEKIVRWIRATREKTGAWPTQHDKEIWDKDAETGAYILQEGRTWAAIHIACTRDRQGLSGLGSLSLLKKKHGLFDDTLLSEVQVLRWLRATHEKTGKWPSADDRDVWDKDAETGQFRLVPDEAWENIKSAMHNDGRGLKGTGSFGDFKKKHGMYDDLDLDEARIVQWIRDTREKTGKWPSHLDKEIWEKDRQGGFRLMEDETWGSIHFACYHGYRGLQGLKSLAELKRKHGLKDELNEALIVICLRVTREKTGKWPTLQDKEVWNKDEEGQHVLMNMSWLSIDRYCENNGLRSLFLLREKHGLNDNLDERQLVRWMRATREKTGKWPSQDDKDVWDRNAQGAFILIENETWRSLQSSCYNDSRGLQGLKSLADIKKKHGLGQLPKKTSAP